MYTFLIVLIVCCAVLLTLLVLVQNSKGGGLAAGFAGGNQVMGAPRTADFLEKATWTLIGIIVVLSILAVGVSKGNQDANRQDSAVVGHVEETVPAVEATVPVTEEAAQE